jgi:putative chitobiose transport system substrate-binding protein
MSTIHPIMLRKLANALCAATAGLVACSALAGTRVEFWTMQLSPHHDAYIRGVIGEFEKRHPGATVKWIDVPWAEMEKKTLAALAAKQTPDVVNLNPQFASRLAEFGALAEPEAYLSREEVAAFLPAAWRANRLKQKTFAVPWYLTTNLVIFNKRLLADADVAPPSDFAELLHAARAVRRHTGRYAYFPALDGSIPLENLVSMGATLVSHDGCRAAFTGAIGEKAMAHYRSMYRDGLVPKNVVTEGHRKAVEMFATREVAMITSGMQFLQGIRSANPALYLDMGVAAQVSEPGIAPNIAAMNLAVLDASPRKAAAFRFVQFLASPENQTAFSKRVPILPSTHASYGDPFFSQPTGDALLDRARALSIEQVRRGEVLVPPMARYNKFRNSWARGLQAVMLDRETSREALARIDREWAALLGCRT